MTDRDPDRERRMRQAEDDSDWDWYYYEYRYEPYSAARSNEYSRNHGQQYGRNYGRGSSQDYERNYGRGFNQDYGQDYERNYGRDFNLYGVHPNPNWMRGQYSGMGPRGYRRSDERMQEDINDRLTWHGQVDATEIMVDVQDGIATLTGTVNSRQEKRLAEDIAESIPGVTDVQNNLKINNQRNWNQSESTTEMNQQTQGETTETSKRKR